MTDAIALSPPLDPTADPQDPLARVMEALRSEAGMPSVGLAMGRLARLLDSDTDAVQELVNLILTDVALTQRLLRMANTLPFRNGAPPVTTVTRGIALLGFDRVRATAVTLVLLEGLMGTANAARLRADFHQSLMAGALARALLLPVNAEEAEEACIAGMFRSVGRLLVAVFAPEASASIRSITLTESVTESVAARRVLGRGFDEVNEAVMREWSMPERITAAVAPLPPRMGRPSDSRERIRMASQFADEVASTLRGADVERGIEKIIERYRAPLAMDRNRVGELVATAQAHARDIEAACGLALTTVTPLQLPPEPGPNDEVLDEASLEQGAAQASVERDAAGRPANAGALLLAGLSDATEALTRGADRSDGLSEVVRIALEAIYTGLGFARASFVMRDASKNMFRSRAGFGEPKANIEFSATPGSDLFHAALARATDLYIADCGTEKVRSALPAWFTKGFADTRSFLLMPLVTNQRPVGFIYADRLVVDAAGMSSEELNLLRALRNQVLLAFRSKG